jgi:hypothetical protein
MIESNFNLKGKSHYCYLIPIIMLILATGKSRGILKPLQKKHQYFNRMKMRKKDCYTLSGLLSAHNTRESSLLIPTSHTCSTFNCSLTQSPIILQE